MSLMNNYCQHSNLNILVTFFLFSCWISDAIAFYVSVLVELALMLALNFTVFLAVLFKLKFRPSGLGGSRKKNEIKLLPVAISLCAIMGLTWITGAVLFAYEHIVLQYLFVLLNTSQGVALFVSFTARPMEVRKLWREWHSSQTWSLRRSSRFSTTDTKLSTLRRHRTSSLQSSTIE